MLRKRPITSQTETDVELKSTLLKIASFVFTLKYRLFYHGRVTFGRNFITNWKLKISGPGKVVFGDNVNAWAHDKANIFMTKDSDAIIKIGDGCRLNGPSFQCQTKIDVAENCLLGSTLLVDTDFHSTAPDRLTNPDAEIKSAPITVEKNVWIAGQAAILKGVTIGKNSIVGFAAVVANDIPANVVAAGNPARVVKRLE